MSSVPDRISRKCLESSISYLPLDLEKRFNSNDTTNTKNVHEEYIESKSKKDQQVLHAVIKFAEECLLSYDGSHDMTHAKKVANNVKRICKSHISLSMIAALLHDTCDPKYVDKDVYIQKIRIFLNTLCDKQEVEDIIDAIQHISFTKLKTNGIPILQTKRAKIIWRNVADADMLEAIGITGVVRTLIHQGHKHFDLKDAHNYIIELLKCVTYIEKAEARKEALKRKRAMEKFIGIMNIEHIIELCQYFMYQGKLNNKFIQIIHNCEPLLIKHDWILQELYRELCFGIHKINRKK
tara:strand:+ start:730 stop:1614 length:885 start_codon:yes stop_codon:yes gene_type:complete